MMKKTRTLQCIFHLMKFGRLFLGNYTKVQRYKIKISGERSFNREIENTIKEITSLTPIEDTVRAGKESV